ncbi:MAG TPA: DUF2127 domain-containing protein [Candidatus Paceibacterota bacterium]
MNTTRRERRIYRFFEVSVVLKGIDAALEIVGGVLALLVPPAFVENLALYFTRAELGEDSHDFIATHLVQLAHHYAAGGELFAALYLLTHGVVKIFLVAGLLRDKLWAYPTSLVVFGLFVAYQVYVYSLSHSLGVAALTLFDLVVMWFIWLEYRVVRNGSKSHA